MWNNVCFLKRINMILCWCERVSNYKRWFFLCVSISLDVVHVLEKNHILKSKFWIWFIYYLHLETSWWFIVQNFLAKRALGAHLSLPSHYCPHASMSLPPTLHSLSLIYFTSPTSLSPIFSWLHLISTTSLSTSGMVTLFVPSASKFVIMHLSRWLSTQWLRIYTSPDRSPTSNGVVYRVPVLDLVLKFVVGVTNGWEFEDFEDGVKYWRTSWRVEHCVKPWKKKSLSPLV